EERGEHEHVVLEAAAALRALRVREAPDDREERRQEEHALQEHGETVYDEGPIEERAPRVDDQREPVEPRQPDGGDEPDLPTVPLAPAQAHQEDHEHERANADLERQHHGSSAPTRSRSPMIAGSTRE